MKNENTKVGFILQGIKCEQFAVFEENYSTEKETGLSTQLELKLDQTNRQIGVFLGFELSQAKKKFIKIVVSCHFIIKDESWNNFIQKNEPKLIISKGFLAHLAMITVGTTRGVLFAKTEGTQFAKFLVPLINVTQIITEDVSFDLKQD
jgi:hypothetical protein